MNNIIITNTMKYWIKLHNLSIFENKILQKSRCPQLNSRIFFNQEFNNKKKSAFQDPKTSSEWKGIKRNSSWEPTKIKCDDGFRKLLTSNGRLTFLLLCEEKLSGKIQIISKKIQLHATASMHEEAPITRAFWSLFIVGPSSLFEDSRRREISPPSE